jgi:hypothetical protein
MADWASLVARVLLAFARVALAFVALVRRAALAGLRAGALRAGFFVEAFGAVGICGAISYVLLAGREERVWWLVVRLYPFGCGCEHLFVTRLGKIVTPGSYHPVNSL